MQAFREGRGVQFRLCIPHRPSFPEISHVFFDKNPIDYDPYDEVSYIFELLTLLGKHYVYVYASMKGRPDCMVIDPFPHPDGGVAEIPPFPEEE